MSRAGRTYRRARDTWRGTHSPESFRWRRMAAARGRSRGSSSRGAFLAQPRGGGAPREGGRLRRRVEQVEVPAERLLLLHATRPRWLPGAGEQVAEVDGFAAGEHAEHDDPGDRGDDGDAGSEEDLS